MPEQTPGRRGSGGWFDPDVAPTRHYAPDELGGLCRECRLIVPAALAGDVEGDTHPTCDPDWSQLVSESRRATRRATPTEGA